MQTKPQSVIIEGQLTRAEGKSVLAGLSNRAQISLLHEIDQKPDLESLMGAEIQQSAMASLQTQPKGLLSNIFGKKTALETKQEGFHLKQADTIFKHLDKRLELQCEALYLRMQDDVNTWLASKRIAARSELITFATNAMQQLKDNLENRRIEFSSYLKRRVTRLESETLSILAEAEALDIKRELEQHLDFLRELEEHFRCAIKERIG